MADAARRASSHSLKTPRSLWAQILAVFGLVILAMAIVFWLVRQWYFAPLLSEIETTIAAEEVATLQRALQREYRLMDQMLADWSYWTASRDYALDPGGEEGRAFAAENFSTTTLANLDLDYLLYLDLQGRVLGGFDRKQGVEIPGDGSAANGMSGSPTSFPLLRPGSPALRAMIATFGSPSSARQDWRALVWHEGIPAMTVSRFLLDSDEGGEPAGILTMVRQLDATRMADLEGATGIQFRMAALPERVSAQNRTASAEDRASRRLMPPGGATALPLEKLQLERMLDRPGRELALTPRGDRWLDVSVALAVPPEQGPSLLAQITLDRKVHRLGQRAADQAMIFTALAVMAVLLVFLLMIGVLVIQPIMQLAAFVSRVRSTQRFEQDQPRANSREMAKLSSEFIDLLEVVKHHAVALQQKAKHDALTGLVNRRGFDDYAAVALKRAALSGQDFSLLLLDIDHFKAYNDFYGHVQGDKALEQVAGAVGRQGGRKSDQIARYGGEEFVAILPDTDLAAATSVAERMREAVAALNLPHAQSPTADRVSISIGLVSGRPTEACTVEAWTSAADQELYRAKNEGRNCVRGRGFQ